MILRKPNPALAPPSVEDPFLKDWTLEDISQSSLTGLRTPLPHQQKALLWAQGRQTCGFLMDMRLGKCLVALRWALGTGSKKILVVAPLSACPGWLGEIEEEGFQGNFLYGTRNQRIEILTIAGISPAADEHPQIYLVNPEGLFIAKGRKLKCRVCGGVGQINSVPPEERKVCTTCDGTGFSPEKGPQPTPIAELPWDCIILDESPVIKNPKSQINHICQEYLSNVPFRAILTGEVAPEGPKDIFEQMRFISPKGSFMGYRKFWPWRDSIFNNIGYDYFLKPGKMAEIKTAMHARCFTMTRKEAGMGETKVFEKRWCELPPKIRKAYESAERNFEIPQDLFIDIDPDLGGGLPKPEVAATPLENFRAIQQMGETKWMIVVFNWLAQMAGGYPAKFPQLHSPHKLRLLEELLTGELRNEHTVVSFRFNAELDAAAALLGKKRISYGILRGSVTPEGRRKLQDSFKAGKTQHILGQVKVLKYGIDLSAADTMIRYSLPLPWEEITQPMHRIMHPTKREALLYIDLLCRNTIDEDISCAVGEKGITARFFMKQIQANFAARTKSLFSQERRAGK